MTAISRRGLMKGTAATLMLHHLPAAAAGAETRDLFAAAWLKGEQSGFSILDGDGNILRDIPLPGRGHDVTGDAQGRWSVAFARRPGTFAVAVDRSRRSAPIVFSSPADRHFFGHGCFTPDGRLLLASENDYDNARGKIGVYDATDAFRRIGEFPSFGIDPHDMVLMADGRTLCIANGGIETHPAFGRTKLNLDSMEPSVVFVDCDNGSLIEKHDMPAALFRLSTRHMGMTADGTVWIGCQYEGPTHDRPPLLWRAARGEIMTPVAIAPESLSRLANYVGSVAANAQAGLVAVTSPHGNCALIIDAQSGRLVSTIEERDVCGVAPHNAAFMFSSGEGRMAGTRASMVWDNHIATLAPAANPAS